MKRQRRRGTTLREWLDEEMKDPEFRRGFEEAGVELKLALEISKAREAKGMSQRDLAQALRTKQQTVSRIELGGQNLTVATLNKIARALGRKLQIKFA
jgi:ribosome-binding protein aMBF1 (putative translation factor)